MASKCVLLYTVSDATMLKARDIFYAIFFEVILLKRKASQVSKQYKNPPISEAVCEFQFGQDFSLGFYYTWACIRESTNNFPFTKSGYTSYNGHLN